MKIYREQSLKSFEFWGGARDRVKYLTDEEFDIIDEYFEDHFHPEYIPSETNLNDLFWFQFDMIAEWLGYKDEEEYFDERMK